MNNSPEIDLLRGELQAAGQRLQAVVAATGPQLGTLEFALDAQGQLCFVGCDASASALITVARPAYFGRPLGEVFVGMLGTDLPAAMVATARDGVPLQQRSFVPPGTRLARAFSLFGFQSAPGRVVLKFWESGVADDLREIARRNQQLLTSIFAESPVAIALVRDRDGILIDVNDEWSRLTGLSRGEGLGRTALQLGLWGDPAERERMVVGLRARGHLHDVPLVFTRRDGRRVQFALHAARVAIDPPV